MKSIEGNISFILVESREREEMRRPHGRDNFPPRIRPTLHQTPGHWSYPINSAPPAWQRLDQGDDHPLFLILLTLQRGFLFGTLHLGKSPVDTIEGGRIDDVLLPLVSQA